MGRSNAGKSLVFPGGSLAACLVPIDAHVVRLAADGHKVHAAVPVEVASGQVLDGDAALVDQRPLPLRPLGVGRLVDPYPPPLARFRTQVIADADDQLVAAVAVEVGAPHGVAPLQLFVDDMTVIQFLRGIIRPRVDNDLVAVPRLDGGEEVVLPQGPLFDLTGAAVTPGIVLVAGPHLRLRPLLALSLQPMDALVTGSQDVGEVPAEIIRNRMEIVDDVQTFIEDLRRPAVAHWVLRDLQREDAHRRAVHPVLRGTAIAAQERHDDQLGLAVAVDIGEADAVDRGLVGNGNHLPRFVKRLAALEPVDWSVRLALETLPAGAKGEVDLPVAIDVVGGDADVVGLRLPFGDDASLPARILVPDHARCVDDDDVLPAVAVDVDEEHGITDAEAFLDFLHPPLGHGRLPGASTRSDSLFSTGWHQQDEREQGQKDEEAAARFHVPFLR